MRYGDPDTLPNKGLRRQEYYQNEGYKRLTFKVDCHICTKTLCKESYMLAAPLDPELLQVHRDFHAATHTCDDCK